MLASQRYDRIVELVDGTGIMDIKELAKILEVTEATIRRDCEKLEQQEKLIRVHGGAKSVGKCEIRSNYNDKEMKERTENYDEKEQVCKYAASFVKEGECVYLDGGTTIVPLLKYLKGKHLKIVTTSTLIANMFEDDNSELFLTGGKYTKNYGMMVGPIVVENLKKFNFDHAFIGCTGIDIQGDVVYTGEVDTMNVKDIAMHQAIKKYLLIDATKIYVRGFYGQLQLHSFDAIVCNDDMGINHDDLPNNFVLVTA